MNLLLAGDKIIKLKPPECIWFFGPKPLLYLAVISLWIVLFSLPLTSQVASHRLAKLDSLLELGAHESFLAEIEDIEQKAGQDTLAILDIKRYLIRYYSRFETNLDLVEELYTQGLSLCSPMHDSVHLYNLQTIYGDHLVNQGRYSEALKIFTNIEPHVERNNYRFASVFYDHYARLLYYLGDYQESFQRLKKEAHILEQRHKPRALSAVYNNLGILYKSQDQIDSSLLYHRRSMAISESLKDTQNVIKSLNNIGNSYESFGDLENSLIHYEMAYKLDPTRATQSLTINYSRLLIISGKYKRAEDLLLPNLEPADNKELKKQTLSSLVTLYKTQGKYDLALKYHEDLLQISEELLDETKVKEIEKLRIQYETIQKEKEIQDLKTTAQSQRTIIRQNKILAFIAVIALLLVVVSFILYQQYRATTTKANTLLLQHKVLHNQMNPHFIFNTLSNIQSTILQKDNSRAVVYLVRFAKMLRHTLQSSFESKITLSQELESIQDYVELQNLRLDNPVILEVSLDPQLEVDLIHIPSMFLQPIIENCYQHGLKNQPNPHITILIKDKENVLHCQIIDNGIGYSNTLDKKDDNKKSLATQIIKDRLSILSQKNKQKLQYHIQDHVQDDIIHGTQVTIDLPILQA